MKPLVPAVIDYASYTELMQTAGTLPAVTPWVTLGLIKNFRHKGLARFFNRGDAAGLLPVHVRRISLVLARLHAATRPEDMALPGLQLHRLKGKEQQRWSVRISGNWRITFAFNGTDAVDIDYEDYH